MPLFDYFAEHHEEFENSHHGSVTYVLLGDAAAYEAAKAYEERGGRRGPEYDRAMAKKVLADLAAANVDRLVETKGLHHIDKAKAKRHAEELISDKCDQYYGLY
ncbi:uncharacterized protein BX664DRAFT_331392 [Halteromyces radiatus]|uniref:uncharacterized protein n=1 Tax=Halteromyces radiatus TaxID=101107 RepID=UPI002221139D|nr:uncharacterized protein BX664DRAFT_331392 [Halteromyces radiatus]KAI8088794.1 hypothetical protein BX664DRAFT_331392 [Halteromyces radiatus]